MNLSTMFWAITDRIYPKTSQQKQDERDERLEGINAALHERWECFAKDTSKLGHMDGWIRGDQTTPEDRIRAIVGLFAGALKDKHGHPLVDMSSLKLVTIKGLPHISASISRLGWLAPFPVPDAMLAYIDPIPSLR